MSGDDSERRGSGDDTLIGLFEAVRSGALAPRQALVEWERSVFDRLDGSGVRADLLREARTGFPEVVYGPGKSPAAVREASRVILGSADRLVVTRASREQFEAVADLPEKPEFHERARLITVGHSRVVRAGRVAVLAAGTTDLPVAEEAALTAEMCGCEVSRFHDVGVAGLHRLLACLDAVRQSRVVIAVAGFEGALASVIGGLVAVPVIAVPTSVGYGATFGGVTALLAMLSSCAPGVTVVNIDNGFGAGFAAGRIIVRRATESG